jgi:[ribosomal protein S5]-alanine N-acetyltransferase
MSPIAQGPRLYLRELEPDDDKAVHAYAGDPEVVTFQTWKPHSPQDSQDWVASVIGHQKKKPRQVFYWGICMRTTGELIGGLGVHRPFPSENWGSAEIGCSIARAHWGEGFGKEAISLALLYVFAKTDIYRLVAHCRDIHSASLQLLDFFGFRREGHYKHDVVIDGRRMSSYSYAILKEELKPSLVKG